MSFSGKMAITTFKLMQNAKVSGGKSGYLPHFLDTLYLLTSSDDEGVTPANEAGISMYFEN